MEEEPEAASRIADGAGLVGEEEAKAPAVLVTAEETCWKAEVIAGNCLANRTAAYPPAAAAWSMKRRAAVRTKRGGGLS